MFETLNRMQQGDLGEARAIYELVKLGYSLSKPLHVHLPYDFIAERDGKLYKVQVKTSGLITHPTTHTYSVYLTTSGGNTQKNTRKRFDSSKVDLVFIMTSDDRCWLIPTSEITTTTSINMGTVKYEKYQVSGPVIERKRLPGNIKKERFTKNCDSRKTEKIDNRKKTPPFTKEQLSDLVFSRTTTEIAKTFNMSDNGVARWCKVWNIEKPGRGYWQKKKVGKV